MLKKNKGYRQALGGTSLNEIALRKLKGNFEVPAPSLFVQCCPA
jgi:hypothetical protein